LLKKAGRKGAENFCIFSISLSLLKKKLASTGTLNALPSPHFMSFQSDSNDNNSTQSDSEVNNTQNTNYNQSQQQHHDEKQYNKGKKKGLPEVDPK
jgi:hypothetical protein